MRRRFALPLLAAALLVSCTGTTEPSFTVLESFELLSIDGDPLPAEAGPEGTSTIHPTAELLELRDNGDVRAILDFIEVLSIGSAMPEARRRQVFDYVVFGDSLRISETPGCVLDACTIARGTKIGDTLTLIRPQWHGSRIFLYARVTPTP